jgi:membrane protein
MSEVLLLALQFGISFIVIALLFATIFKVLPDARIAWRDVWIGAISTTLLLLIGKFLIGLYLGQSNPGEAYGAAGSLAILLVWIYYSAMILFLGAEFTQVWADERGSGVKPEEGAVRVNRTPSQPQLQGSEA